MTPPSRDEARKRLASCADYPESRRSDGVLLTTVRVDDLRALLSPEQGWREIESAPKDRPFWARQSNGEIALCWRHAPSSRTDEVVTWKGNRPFRAVDWRLPDPLPAPPTKGGE